MMYILPRRVLMVAAAAGSRCRCTARAMDLDAVVKVLEEFAPRSLAEDWDNTGLLVEGRNRRVSRVLFTNDLTECVVDEAVSRGAHLVVSYHPPLFSPLKSLQSGRWKERVLLHCIEHSLSVYSPHTAWDSVQGGVNDWLISAFELASWGPIKPHFDKESFYIDVFLTPDSSLEEVLGANSKQVRESLTMGSKEGCECKRIRVSKESMVRVVEVLSHSKKVTSINVTSCDKASCGMGRVGRLSSPLKLQECVQRIKAHLHLEHIRVSFGVQHTPDSEVGTVAVCAGSGSEVLRGADAELFVTGEMSHHNLLDASHRGTTVILCEHSNSERGFLATLVGRLGPQLQQLELLLSYKDRDPVVVL